jgi:hypothetical protein
MRRPASSDAASFFGDVVPRLRATGTNRASSEFVTRIFAFFCACHAGLVPPEPCAKAETPWRRRIKKFNLLEIFGNFTSDFRDWDSEQQKLQTKNQTKRNDIHEHTNENTYVSAHV